MCGVRVHGNGNDAEPWQIAACGEGIDGNADLLSDVGGKSGGCEGAERFCGAEAAADRRGAAGTKAKLYRGKRRQLRIYQQEILRRQQRDSENHGGKRIGKCRYDFRGADTADSVRGAAKIGESLWF